jgi:hypothetical protein
MALAGLTMGRTCWWSLARPILLVASRTCLLEWVWRPLELDDVPSWRILRNTSGPLLAKTNAIWPICCFGCQPLRFGSQSRCVQFSLPSR